MKCPVCQNKMCQLFVSWVCDHCDKAKNKAGINDWCKRTDLQVQFYHENLPVGKRTPISFIVEDFSRQLANKPYYTGRCSVYHIGHVDRFTVQDANNKVYYEYVKEMTVTGCCTCNIVLPAEKF